MVKTIAEEYPKFKLFFDNPESRDVILIRRNPLHSRIIEKLDIEDQLEFLHLIYLWTIENRLFKEYDKKELSFSAEHYEIGEITTPIIKKEISLINRLIESNTDSAAILQYYYNAKVHISSKRLYYISKEEIEKFEVFIDSQIEEYERINKKEEDIVLEKIEIEKSVNKLVLLYVTGIFEHLINKYPHFKEQDTLFANFLGSILNISDKKEIKNLRTSINHLKNENVKKGPINKTIIKKLKQELIKFDITIPNYGFDFKEDMV